MPKNFLSAIGGKFPRRLSIYCKTLKWRARYDSEVNKICGLANFMEYYGIKIFNIVQFDYFGNGFFNVKIYKEAGIEINYPIIHPDQWFINKTEWKDEEYMVEYGNMQFDKAIALLVFNAFLNKSESYRIEISSADLEQKGVDLVRI